MRKLLAVLLVCCLLAVLAASALAATKSVRVDDNYYVRPSGVPTVSVSRNSTVAWSFRGSAPHNVVVKSGPVKFRSAVKTSGSYRRKMTRRGTYVIYCTIHGYDDMRMRLVVK